MADLPDAAALLEPVSADAPCGPDLDLAGDPDFYQATGRIEGMLPSSFFQQDAEGQLQPFDRTSIEIRPALQELGKLLLDTRDLRLLTLAARLCALNRDLPALLSGFEGVAALLKERWSDVHPQGEDGDFGLRLAILQTLDDPPTVALPLQYIPLLESRRSGAVTWRAIMVANGDVAAPEGETWLDRPAIDRAFAEADLDALRATHSRLTRLAQALDAIRIATIEGAGFENAVTFPRLGATLPKMVAALEQVLSTRDPSAVPALPAGMDETDDAAGDRSASAASSGPVRPAGPIRDIGDAAQALASAGAYLRAREPSSPAELLVRQAGMLVGKSFLDVMRILVPSLAEEAKIGIGADRVFELTFGQLCAVAESRPAEGSGPDEATPPDDDWNSWDTPAEETAPADAETADESASAADAKAEPALAPSRPPAESRREALDLLRQVSSFYRVAEPSSPIPLLLDRAASMVETDFLTILKDVLPQLANRNYE